MRGPEMGRGSCSCWSGAGPPTRGWLAFTGDAAAAYNPLNPRLGFLGVYSSSSAAGEEEGGTGGPAPLEETPGCCAPRVSGRLHPSAPRPSASEFLPGCEARGGDAGPYPAVRIGAPLSAAGLQSVSISIIAMARRRAWSFLVYDQYVMIDAAGNRHVYFDDDGMTVAQFKRRYGMVVTAGHNYQVDGIPLLPGELEKWKSWFIASDISLRAARSILKILEIVEAEGACLAPFDATDLRIYPTGDVKLKGDMVLENLDAVQLDERLRRGYVSAATVIEGFYGKRIPPDLEHLVKLMKTDFSARAIFPIHAGLVPIAAYPSVLKEIYDHARFVIPKAHMRTILSTLQAEIPKISDWQALARTNALLTIILDYKDYDVPPNYGQQIELNLLEAKALHELGLDQTPKQTSLTRLQIEQFRALKLFEFLRHRTSHRMDCYQKWMATPKKDASTAQGTNDASTAQGTEQVAPPMNDAFTAQGTERVARVRYPLVLPVVQLKLHKMGHLAALPIRDLF